MGFLVSNSKGVIYHFLSIDNKYIWVHVTFMVDTGIGAKNVFRRLQQIHLVDTNHQANGYFGLLGFGNVGNQVLPNSLVVSTLQKLDKNLQKVQDFYDSVISDMIAKAMEDSITTTSIKKLQFHRGEYVWSDEGCLLSNDGTTMIYLLLKSINPATRIGVSNLKN